MATEWIFFQRRLHLGRQSVHTGAHVGHAGRQPNFSACGQADHGSSRASNNVSVAVSTRPSRRTCT